MIFIRDFICCSSRAKISASNKLSANHFPFTMLPTLEKLLWGLGSRVIKLKCNSTGVVMNLSKTILCLLKPIHYRKLSVAVVEPTTKCFLIPVNQPTTSHKCFCSNSLISENERSKKSNSVLDPIEPLDLTDYGSVVRPSFKLAAFVDKSPLLQMFLKLGVDLNALDKVRGIQDLILRLNYEKTVKPCLSFLKDCGVSEEDLGAVITKHPFLFKEDLNDLEVRINYLKSKKFDKEMISQIIIKHPNWLSVPVKRIDERLGFLQQNLALKGFQVRKMICKVPSLATVKERRIHVNLYVLKEEMGLDEHSLKKIVMIAPSLLKRNEYDLVRTFEYIKNVMKVPVDLIAKQAFVLTFRRFMIEPRHKFLERLGRAQYNPKLPGYVSLASFVETDDEEFCEKIAKASIHTYNEFLKTL